MGKNTSDKEHYIVIKNEQMVAIAKPEKGFLFLYQTKAIK